MGEVHEAYDERLDRRVALKLIRPDRVESAAARERLRREARASARLNHPNIVQIYDILQTEEADCIVMELVQGETLAQRLRRGPLDMGTALPVAREIAAALEEAHAAGIVHRDLKTENVILTPAGRAKVLDFGIAKHLASGGETSLTVAGVIIGTCRAMSPEQAQGHEIDARSDLFSFGTLLYEIVTGKSPFLASPETATLLRICHFRQRPAREENPEVPEALSVLIDRLLAKNPQDRPPSASAVVQELARVYTQQAGRSAPEGVTNPGTPSSLELTLATDVIIRFQPSATGPHEAGGERRQVTVVDCGLVRVGGGMPDLEDLLAGMSWIEPAADEVARRYEGSPGPAAGDGAQILFGYPQSHEDNARRAVLAALELAAVAARDDGLAGSGLALQIGIHTGPLVAARKEGSDRVDLALGETAHVAAVLRRGAGAGAVLMSEATHRLVEASFDCEPLPVPLQAGPGRPVAAYRTLADRGVGSRVESGEIAALTPMVARGRELELLLDRWALVEEGRGQVVLLAGDAGIGKSRLLRELRQRLAPGAPVWLDVRCSPFHRNSAFHPFLEVVRRRLGEEAAPADQLSALEALLEEHGFSLAETVPMFAALLSLPLGERYAPPSLPIEGQRAKTLEALAGFLLAEAERRPALLTVEDLHWSDPSSRELLGVLIEQVAACRMLVMITFRPELQPSWGHRSYLTQWTLGPLTCRQSEEMVGHMTGGRRLPAGIGEQLIAKADGVPLILEELLKAVLESDLLREGEHGYEMAGALHAFEIPATLRDSLTARLDRLGPGKEVAQLASVLGRELSTSCSPRSRPGMRPSCGPSLDRLVDAELLYRRGLPPKVRYLFKHALIQDAAYASLLRGKRQQWHRRIAEVLERHFPERAEAQPELMAHHYTEAGLQERAIELWTKAGELANRRCANLEATGHLGKGLELLAGLPPSRARDRRELALQLTLGAALIAACGYTDLSVERAYLRAQELAEKVGDAPEHVWVLLGLYVNHLVGGDVPGALHLAELLVRLGESGQDPLLRAASFVCRGPARFYLGELAEALADLERAGELAPADASAFLLNTGTDLRMLALVFGALVLWFLGYPERALQRSREALERAKEIAHPHSLAFAQITAAVISQYRRDAGNVRRLAREGIEICERQGFPHWLPEAVTLAAWGAAQAGEPGEADAVALRRTIDEAGGVAHAYHLSLLAEILLAQGQREEAAATLDEALARVAPRGRWYWEPEILRLCGESSLGRDGDEAEAERAFAKALDLARQQGARALEAPHRPEPRTALAASGQEGGRARPRRTGPRRFHRGARYLGPTGRPRLSRRLHCARPRDAGGGLNRISRHR